MPQTDPFSGIVPRKLSDTELARAIRLNIEAELDAINLYAAHIDATDNDEAKAILHHVMDEEKEHMALFLELLKRMDSPQLEHLGEASAKYRLIVSGASKEEIEAVGEGGGNNVDSGGQEPVQAKSFTVGNLRK
jgi:hypothetical protein